MDEVVKTRKKKCKLKDSISTVDDCIMDSSQPTTGRKSAALASSNDEAKSNDFSDAA